MHLRDAVNIEDLRGLAKRRLPRAIFDFFDGGAEDETTLRGNRAAFERVRLLPKVLVNVAQVDTGTEIFGRKSSLPLAIAPTGGISAGRWGAELILARAAKAWGVPFTMATPSAFSIERVAQEVGGRLWFQLYCVRNIEFRNKLVARAKDAGFDGIELNYDLESDLSPKAGTRECVIKDMPGYPDNINRASDGNYWMAWLGMRTPSFDLSLRHPAMRKRMTRRLPQDEWLFPNINTGGVVKFDETGRIVETLGDMSGESHPMVTSMREHKGWLYVGGILNNRIGRYRIPGADQSWTGPDSYWRPKP